eukprot:7780521-Prorocentrum_lima.AAC.1
MLDIIGNAKKCIGANHWVSLDPAQPNTVEFWLRIFQAQMDKKPAEEWIETRKSFVKFVTKSCFECREEGAVSALIPLVRKLTEKAPEHVPLLAKALVQLHDIDFSAAPAAAVSERAFHEELQSTLNIGNLQYLYG